MPERPGQGGRVEGAAGSVAQNVSHVAALLCVSGQRARGKNIFTFDHGTLISTMLLTVILIFVANINISTCINHF